MKQEPGSILLYFKDIYIYEEKGEKQGRKYSTRTYNYYLGQN